MGVRVRLNTQILYEAKKIKKEIRNAYDIHLPTTEVLCIIRDTLGPGRLCLLGEESFDFSWINEAPNAVDDDDVDGGFIWRLATNDVADWGTVWVVFRLLNSVPDWFGTMGALVGVSIMVLFFDNAWGAGLLIN